MRIAILGNILQRRDPTVERYRGQRPSCTVKHSRVFYFFSKDIWQSQIAIVIIEALNSLEACWYFFSIIAVCAPICASVGSIFSNHEPLMMEDRLLFTE